MTHGGSIIVADGQTSIQPDANGQTSMNSNAVVPGLAVVQNSGPKQGSTMGDGTFMSEGPASTTYGSTILVRPTDSSVRVVVSGQTSIVPVAASFGSFSLQTGDSSDEYRTGDSPISAGDSTRESAGLTSSYPALPPGTGIVLESNKESSRATTYDQAAGETPLASDLDLPKLPLSATSSQQSATVNSSVLVTSHLTFSGSATGIDGAAPTQTEEISSSTHGTGDAIVSGIGGVATRDTDHDPASSAESTVARALSDARRKSAYAALSVWIVLASIFALNF